MFSTISVNHGLIATLIAPWAVLLTEYFGPDAAPILVCATFFVVIRQGFVKPVKPEPYPAPKWVTKLAGRVRRARRRHRRQQQLQRRHQYMKERV